MKFNVTKQKKNFEPNALKSAKGTNLNNQDNLKEKESKSVNMLFSIKAKTKMKRSHHKMHGIVINPTVLSSCQNEKILADSNNQDFVNVNFKCDKDFKKVSLKQIGVSFANLFKQNVRNCIFL